MLAMTLVLSLGTHLIEGNPASAVRVVVYEDLQCPDCAVFRRMMDDKLLPAYAKTVAFEHRDFPLPRHAWARPAAIAARFFQEIRPELAVSFRRHTMQNIKQTTAENFKERLAAFAKANGVDPRKAEAALEDQRLAALVEQDYQEGVARGVARTPTVLVNGAPFIERFSVEEISKGIEAALKP
ncbi:MAG: thioredoxin domain-containing protein [Acidobacteriota bacterium]